MLPTKLPAVKRKQKLLDYLRSNYDLYLFLVPGLLALVIFKYIPILGISVAFKDFTLREGIIGSPWANPWFLHFQTLFALPQFIRVVTNTLIINLYMLVFQWPIPIILAIAISEIGSMGYKRVAQTVTYMPHFLSWVVVGAIFIDILSTQNGLVNIVLGWFGVEPVLFLARPPLFRPILVISQAWKESGWASIIYLAALQSIDPQLYDAARIDGATKMQQVWRITLPGLLSTMVFVVLLRIARALDYNVQQIIMLYNPLVYERGDVISSYIYRVGLQQLKFSLTTALGVFKGLIGLLMVVFSNYLARRFAGRGLF